MINLVNAIADNNLPDNIRSILKYSFIISLKMKDRVADEKSGYMEEVLGALPQNSFLLIVSDLDVLFACKKDDGTIEGVRVGDPLLKSLHSIMRDNVRPVSEMERSFNEWYDYVLGLPEKTPEGLSVNNFLKTLEWLKTQVEGDVLSPDFKEVFLVNLVFTCKCHDSRFDSSQVSESENFGSQLLDGNGFRFTVTLGGRIKICYKNDKGTRLPPVTVVQSKLFNQLSKLFPGMNSPKPTLDFGDIATPPMSPMAQ